MCATRSLMKTEPAPGVGLYALCRSAFQSCVFAQDSKSWKATSGNSRRSAARSTAKPTRSNQFVHPNGILAHALADDIERDLVIAKGAAGDTREDGEGFIPRELVARDVEALAGEATRAL